MIPMRKTEEKDKKSQKIGKNRKNRQKWLKIGFMDPLKPPDRPRIRIFQGQQLYTYALGYSNCKPNIT